MSSVAYPISQNSAIDRIMIENRRHWLGLSAVLVLWLALAAIIATNHVPWRDEVSELSMAVNATSPQSLYEEFQPVGHPLLWFAILNSAHHVYSNPAVLKVLGVTIVFLSVALFLFRAPFPVWFRCLFIFCGLPLFEYAVMARKYGISMLLLFAFAWAYTSKRRNPVLLGLILSLLANITVHSMGFALLLLGVSAWDSIQGWHDAPHRPSRVAVASGIGLALAGVLLCVLTIIRAKADSIFMPETQPINLTALYESVKHAGWEFRNVTGADMFLRFRAGAGHLLTQFFGYLVVLLAIAGLAGRPLLASAALASLWGLSLVFTAMYPGLYRHQGLWLAFVLILYWLAEARPDPPNWQRVTQALRTLSLYVVLPLILLLNCVHGARAVIDDWRRPYSSSRQLAQVLNSRPDLKEAVVISNPDLMLDALPYYVRNRLYFVAVSQYGNVSSYSRSQKLDLSLGDILVTARRLHSETGNPIVILLHQALDRPYADMRFPWGFRFSWTEADLTQFRRETTRLASLRAAASDENYDVYLLSNGGR